MFGRLPQAGRVLHGAGSRTRNSALQRSIIRKASSPLDLSTTWSTPIEVSPSPAGLWKKVTLRLLESPVGKLGSFRVQESERALHWWTCYKGKDEVSDAEAIVLLFRLLDRLRDEIMQASDPSADSVGELLSYRYVSGVVNRWRLLLKGCASNLPDSLSPESVLEKVESYASVSPIFRPDQTLYNMVLAGMGSFYADKSQDLSIRLHGFLNHMRQKGCPPDAITYATAIHVLSLETDTVEAAKQTVAMLETMKKNSAESPTLAAYGAVLGALARSIRNQEDKHKLVIARQAEALLQEMQENYGIAPCTLCMSHVLFAWTQTMSAQAGDRAQAILDRMLREYFDSNNKNRSPDLKGVKPNNYCFSTVMSAHAKNGRVKQVDELLHRLQTLYEQSNGDPDFLPNVFCFNALIEAWSYSPQEQGSKTRAQHAEEVLQRMVDYSEITGRMDCLPNLVSFNLVLRVHSHEKTPSQFEQAASRSLAILETMKTLGIPPDSISYNLVLESFRKCSHNPHWTRKAEWLVQEEMPEPDVLSYRNLIRAVAGNGNAERAEAVLMDMCASRSRGVRPDASCFNAVIAAWSRSKSLDAGTRAEALLRTMKLDQNIEPDAVTYNSTMACWTSMAHRRPEAAERAWTILRYMQKESHAKPSVFSYTTCMWALAATRQPQKAEELFVELEEIARKDPKMRPKQITYCALVSAWAKVGHASKAQIIFDTMLARSSMGDPVNGDPSLRPNTELYSTLLHAWAIAGDVERAVGILQKMCNDYMSGKNTLAVPNERCFGSVIDALSKSKHPDAAPQAEACLLKMQEMADGGLVNVRPTVFTFQSIISAWANSDLEVAAQEAERNLQLLKDFYHKEGYAKCRPNVIAYTNTLRAWLHSSRRRPNDDDGRVAVRRSEAILAEMLASELPEVRPNRITYGTVLRTIADSRLPDKMARAQRICRVMEESGVPVDQFARDQIERIRKSSVS